MAIETTYSAARANLSKLLDRVVDDAETVVIRRRNGKGVALIDLDEWERMSETAYLMAPPANRKRLLAAFRESLRHRGKKMTISQLKKSVGL
jgi:antitoxin YefM